MMLLKRKTSAETLKLQEKYGVPYLVFPSLENTGLVRHAFLPAWEAAVQEIWQP